MLIAFFHQMNMFTLERDCYELLHHLPVPTLGHDLGDSPLRYSIVHHHYKVAVQLIARGCCD